MHPSTHHSTSTIAQGTIDRIRRSTSHPLHPMYPHQKCHSAKGIRRSDIGHILRKQGGPPPPQCYIKHPLALSASTLRHSITPLYLHLLTPSQHPPKPRAITRITISHTQPACSFFSCHRCECTLVHSHQR